MKVNRGGARRGRGPRIWTAAPEWEGEAAFVICGGTSVLQQDLSLLRGRKVCVINSSAYTYPDADLLYFGDLKWWREHRLKLKDSFKGRMVTVDVNVPPEDPVLRMHKTNPPGLSYAANSVMQRATSLTAIINLLVHMHARPIVLLGADGCEGKDEKGKPRTHHHAPHKWEPRSDRFGRWRADLATIVPQLKMRGIEVLNVSPGTQWEWWPVYQRIEDVLEIIEAGRAA